MRHVFAPLAATALLLAACLCAGCPTQPTTARAKQISTRAELIGGPRALGEVGDWLLENDKIRVIVQGEGFSRGFGVFGGGILDADLVRTATGRGDSLGGTGQDNFGEMFPAFFLEALDPREVFDPNDPSKKLPAIEVENDGSDGKAAVVVVRGTGGDFLAMTQILNETLLDEDRQAPRLYFEMRYILEPGAQYVTLESKVQNIAFPPEPMSFNTLAFGSSPAVPTPFGDVLLFGAGNKVFLPHDAGYDLRYRLESVYKSGGFSLPAIPGLVGEYLASASEHVSYGLVYEPVEGVRNFAYENRDQFVDAKPHSVHVPFIASAFTGVFQALPPNQLAANDRQPGGPDEFTFRRHFVVGSGDVASITEVVLRDVLGEKTGTIAGRLLEVGTGRALDHGEVFVLDDAGTKVTVARVHENGHFRAVVRPGRYRLAAVVPGRDVVKHPDPIEVAEGGTARPEVRIAAPAELVVTIVDPALGPVPAKATLVGTAPADRAGQDTKGWLFDLSIGEPWRYSDLVPDDADDPDTLRFIEDFAYARDGVVRMTARPGSYKLVVSRGPEYERFETDVQLVAGATRTVTADVRRVVDTTGYVAADFHLHSQYSLDSDHSISDRLLSYAGEGMEYAVSTDHNFVVDYGPALADLQLQRFMGSAVGIELTTIDRGHFNGFPIERGAGSLVLDREGDGSFVENPIASRTYGSFPWALRDPADIFGDLRAMATKGEDGNPLPVLVQVNHPRDTILGYFEQYAVDADDLVVHGQSGLLAPKLDAHPEFAAEKFSFDFDAVEVFNGKRYEFLHSFRVPEGRTVDPVSCCPVVPGEVLREREAFDCDETIPGDCTCDEAKALVRQTAGACDAQGEVAFPGVVEDWFLLLRTGKRVIGTANSDSHEPHKEEPGNPRTYIRVPQDVPSTVTPSQLVASFESGDVLMTNGPFVVATAKGDGQAGMGGVVKPAQGSVEVEVEVRTASWVKVDRIALYKDGVKVDERAIAADEQSPYRATFDVLFQADGFLVVEASGDDSMFPTYYPNEIPPLQFTDVLGSLGESFGLGVVEGALEPQLTSVTTPFALTNPIWVDFDGDGDITPLAQLPDPAARTAARSTVPPAPVLGRLPWGDMPYVPTEAEVRAELELRAFRALPLRKQIALSRLPRWLWPTDDQRDVRRVLVQFSRHGE